MRRRSVRVCFLALGLALSLFLPRRGTAQTAPTNGQPPAAAKAAAPIDLTGYWVAVITEDWRERMVPPAKGDYLNIPITLKAKNMADNWDPAKDEAAGEQCRSYGAPAIMATPTRLHITWQDDNTMKVETDYGMQTRLFHFGSWKAPGGAATWQGDSVASWELSGSGTPANAAAQPKPGPKFGNLKVVTTHIRPGYLRKNGIPYSANATMTEYWDVYPVGDQRLMITQRVEDSEHISRPWITALQFKKEASGAKWDPTPCSAKW